MTRMKPKTYHPSPTEDGGLEEDGLELVEDFRNRRIITDPSSDTGVPPNKNGVETQKPENEDGDSGVGLGDFRERNLAVLADVTG